MLVGRKGGGFLGKYVGDTVSDSYDNGLAISIKTMVKAKILHVSAIVDYIYFPTFCCFYITYVYI